MTTYSADRAGLTLAERRSMLVQDVHQLERGRPADLPRAVLREGGPARAAYYTDIHDRSNLIGWIRNTLTIWDREGDEGMDAWCRSNRTPLGLADYLARIEDEVAAFKAGGAAARRAHLLARDVPTIGRPA
jgi:hypothetical protein